MYYYVPECCALCTLREHKGPEKLVGAKTSNLSSESKLVLKYSLKKNPLRPYVLCGSTSMLPIPTLQ